MRIRLFSITLIRNVIKKQYINVPNRNGSKIGFTFFKQNIISYLFILILGWNITGACS